MVLSYMQHPYDKLYEAQVKTFGSLDIPNVDVLFYFGGGSSGVVQKGCTELPSGGKIINVVTHHRDDYFFMAGKFKGALEEVINDKWDVIFRTNSSSYVNKIAAVRYAQTLPSERLYAGWEIKTNEGFSMVSGAGFFITKDVAQILINEIDPDFEKEEDYYIGSILKNHNIPVINDRSRFDISSMYIPVKMDRYHYRFKTDDRVKDAQNIIELHRKLFSV